VQRTYNLVHYDYEDTVGKGHSRIETRRCWTMDDPNLLAHVDSDRDWVRLGQPDTTAVGWSNVVAGNHSTEDLNQNSPRHSNHALRSCYDEPVTVSPLNPLNTQ
jgi:hypothetical protein